MQLWLGSLLIDTVQCSSPSAMYHPELWKRVVLGETQGEDGVRFTPARRALDDVIGI